MSYFSRIFPATSRRVPANTADATNDAIARRMEESVIYYASHKEEIGDRLAELEREWDTERTLEANASGLMLVGLTLGTFVSRRFLALPVAVSSFLLQHALQGWCPPLPILRRCGVRTMTEIEQERTALKYLRGDFGDIETGVPPEEQARRALEAVTL